MSEFAFNSVVVLGATGQIGRALVPELVRRKVRVRCVSRSDEHLRKAFGSQPVECVAADLCAQDEAVRAVEGRDVAICCVGFPLSQFSAHATLAARLGQAMKQTKVRLVLVTSLWSYSPVKFNPVSEAHPRSPTSDLAAVRRQEEDELMGLGACVLATPDLFGPGAGTARGLSTGSSMLNAALGRAANGKSVRYLGDPDVRREFMYLPDLPRVIAEVGAGPGAYGRRWNIAGSGPIEPRKLLEQAAGLGGKPLACKPVTKFELGVAGVLDGEARMFKDILPHYQEPAWVDGSKLKRALGGYYTTPYSDAVEQTVRWLREGSGER
ncbi:MAG: NAD(P)H-binding protein [Planctomycetota bacterium]|nr:NAD(P)H-binding protein [Planctomycetota bacterium]